MNNKNEELNSIDEYFHYFEEYLNEKNQLKELKQVYTIFFSLRDEFKKVVVSENITFFEKISRVLELEAKLQLVVNWFGDQNWQSYFDEEKIIQSIEEDIGCYYRELTGLSKNSKIPRGIIYMSEK